MYKELEKQAKQKVEAKKAFFILSIVFSAATIILLMLSFYLPGAAFWLRLPIPAFLMVLGVLYLTAFGLPATDGTSKDWEEQELKKEMIKLYRQNKDQFAQEEPLTESEKLELKELERLKKESDLEDEYV